MARVAQLSVFLVTTQAIHTALNREKQQSGEGGLPQQFEPFVNILSPILGALGGGDPLSGLGNVHTTVGNANSAIAGAFAPKPPAPDKSAKDKSGKKNRPIVPPLPPTPDAADMLNPMFGSSKHLDRAREHAGKIMDGVIAGTISRSQEKHLPPGQTFDSGFGSGTQGEPFAAQTQRTEMPAPPVDSIVPDVALTKQEEAQINQAAADAGSVGAADADLAGTSAAGTAGTSAEEEKKGSWWDSLVCLFGCKKLDPAEAKEAAEALKDWSVNEASGELEKKKVAEPAAETPAPKRGPWDWFNGKSATPGGPTETSPKDLEEWEGRYWKGDQQRQAKPSQITAGDGPVKSNPIAAVMGHRANTPPPIIVKDTGEIIGGSTTWNGAYR